MKVEQINDDTEVATDAEWVYNVFESALQSCEAGEHTVSATYTHTNDDSSTTDFTYEVGLNINISETNEDTYIYDPDTYWDDWEDSGEDATCDVSIETANLYETMEGRCMMAMFICAFYWELLLFL